MEWSILASTQVIAPAAGLVGIIVGAGISSWTTRSTHGEKIRADQVLAERKIVADIELTERKVVADIALAEKKLALDRGLVDWKRRTELAEEMLGDFYKAREVFNLARTPFAFTGEGATRVRQEGEDAADARHHDAIYAPYERLFKEKDFLSEMQAKRFRFMALFGREAGTSFRAFTRNYNRIGVAVRALIDDRRHLPAEQIRQFEKLIGWTRDDDDPVMLELDQAVLAMEAICRPVLQMQPK